MSDSPPKRSRHINLRHMRKSGRNFHLKPLAAALSAVTLLGCGSSHEAMVYRDVSDCIQDNPHLEEQCEKAYQRAQAESLNSGPKYASERDCNFDFGRDNCVAHTGPQGQNWFIPAMAGFMFARLLDDGYYRNGFGYGYSPLYTSYSRYSPHYGKWSTVDGKLYGSRRYGSIKVSGDAFKPKPKVVRTMSRGGFGSKVAAKSSWGGSSSRSGWGG